MAKRLAQFSIVIFCLAALLSCGSKQSDAIRFGLASMPSNLDPRFYTSAIETRIGRLIYDRLVDFDESMMAKPALASWQQITPKLYRFTIQDQNKTFHDGKRLTSADVKATYDFILEEKHASPHRTSVKLIEKITTPDERTIDFHLQYEDPLFPAYLVIGIVPKHLSESDHSFKIHPIGSGSFEFVDWSSEEKLRIQRIEDRTPFEFLHVQNPTVRVLKLMRGEIDMVQNDLPPELIHYLRDQS
ncbi:MAG: ABC transporter substrate-binding protein, partial [Gammaproteobacteria bacterium]|nr:ABC transporter substrate-binding protein [Gammaproteobacteria bacterium]